MRSSIHRPVLATAACHMAGHVGHRVGDVVPGDSTTLEILCIRIGATAYGLPLLQVEGLLHFGQVPAGMGGAGDWGRPPLLQLDLADLLGREGPDGVPPSHDRAIVVVTQGEHRLGLIVDEVMGARSLFASQLRPAVAEGGFADQHRLAVAQVDGRPLQLLSADTWFELAASPYVVQA